MITIKEIIAVLLTVILTAGVPTAAFASSADEVRQALYGVVIRLEHPPLEQDGHNFVPLEAVADFLGTDFLWDESARAATVTFGTVSVVLEADSEAVVIRDNVTGQESAVTLPVPPAMVFGTMIMPIEAVLVSLGNRVRWESPTQLAILPPLDSAEIVFRDDFRVVINDRETGVLGVHGEALHPFTLGDDLYLPLGFLLYFVGDYAEWDIEAGILRIEGIGAELAGQREYDEMIDEYADSLPVPLNVAAPFFDRSGSYAWTETSVLMGGREYSAVLVYRNPAAGSWTRQSEVTQFTLHNLSGKYSRLFGRIGRVDGTGQHNSVFNFLGDGELLGSFGLEATGLPIEVSVNVEGVNLLKIEVIISRRGASDHLRSPLIDYAFSSFIY